MEEKCPNCFVFFEQATCLKRTTYTKRTQTMLYPSGKYVPSHRGDHGSNSRAHFFSVLIKFRSPPYCGPRRRGLLRPLTWAAAYLGPCVRKRVIKKYLKAKTHNDLWCSGLGSLLESQQPRFES
jgi:hypothetical protein